MLLNVPGMPWTDLGVRFKSPILTSRDIAIKSKMDYTVSAHCMEDDQTSQVLGYHSYYRDDTMTLLGVVNHKYPSIVQNVDAFRIFEPMLENGLVSVETAGTYGSGVQTFAVFEIKEPFKVLGDEIKHYFIAINDFMKPDGKITILNTPIRITCLNMLSHAINRCYYKLRMPVVADQAQNDGLSNELYNSATIAISNLNLKAERMVGTKITQEDLNKMIDKLFPLPATPTNEFIETQKAVETVMLQRDTFVQCLDVDNLQNFKGTVYWVYNAFADYAQHYFKNADKGFDLQYRMNMIPGFTATTDTENTKLMKLTKDLLAMCK